MGPTGDDFGRSLEGNTSCKPIEVPIGLQLESPCLSVAYRLIAVDSQPSSIQTRSSRRRAPAAAEPALRSTAGSAPLTRSLSARCASVHDCSSMSCVGPRSGGGLIAASDWRIDSDRSIAAGTPGSASVFSRSIDASSGRSPRS